MQKNINFPKINAMPSIVERVMLVADNQRQRFSTLLSSLCIKQ